MSRATRFISLLCLAVFLTALVPCSALAVPSSNQQSKLNWVECHINEEGWPQLWISLSAPSGLVNVIFVRHYTDENGQPAEERYGIYSLYGANNEVRYRTLRDVGQYSLVINNLANKQTVTDIIASLSDTDGNGVPDTFDLNDGSTITLQVENAFAPAPTAAP